VQQKGKNLSFDDFLERSFFFRVLTRGDKKKEKGQKGGHFRGAKKKNQNFDSLSMFLILTMSQ